MSSLEGFAASAIRRTKSGLARCRDLFLPPQCLLTGEPVAVHGQLSPAGWQQLDFITAPFCGVCGIPFQVSDGESNVCAACLTPDGYAGKLISEAGLDRIRAALRYDDTSGRLVMGLKYADRLDGAKPLADLIARAGRDLLAANDAILVPVPLHRSRLRSRRFNQAALLAAELGNATGCAVVLDFLQRRRATPQQQGLTAKARKRNVKGAFAVREQYREHVRGKRFILIDDVLTTGSTLVECAKALKRAGAEEVTGLVLARVVKGDVVAI